jgi:hypothetical protein
VNTILEYRFDRQHDIHLPKDEDVVVGYPVAVRTVGLWRVSIRFKNPDDNYKGCVWCGPDSHRSFVYGDWDIVYHVYMNQFHPAVDGLPGPYCSLHCWGQENGWTEL